MKPEHLPPFLYEAKCQAEEKTDLKGFKELVDDWHTFANQTIETFPAANYAAEKELLYLGDVSPGCVLCREGKWDCLFVTHQCNLNCPFCISPRSDGLAFAGSNIGNPSELKDFYTELDVQGVSFSGGEALLEPARLTNWMNEVNQISNIQYQWIYTNSLLLSDAVMESLSSQGIDEVRVNTAAAGYTHPQILDALKKASAYFSTVTIEIPMIPEGSASVLAALPQWVECGVKFLNLHEFIYEPDSNSASFAGERQSVQLPDEKQVCFNPESQQAVTCVFEAVHEHEYPISVNFCSTVGKWKQLTKRREMLLPKTMKPFENYTGEGIIERYYRVSRDSYVPVLAEDVTKQIGQAPTENYYRLERIAPLSPKERKEHWIQFDTIHEGF